MYIVYSQLIILQFQPQFPQLLQLFSAALDDGANKMVSFYALK